jgi:hypothetical protein
MRRHGKKRAFDRKRDLYSHGSTVKLIFRGPRFLDDKEKLEVKILQLHTFFHAQSQGSRLVEAQLHRNIIFLIDSI